MKHFVISLLLFIIILSCSDETNTSNSTNPPLPPQNLTVTMTDSSNYLTWELNKNAEVYEVYYKTSSNQLFAMLNSEKLINSFEHKDIQNGTNYYYRVTAGNHRGTSGFSNEVIAIRIPLAPENLQALADTGKVFITWDITDNNADNFTLYWANHETVTLSDNSIPNVRPPYCHNNLLGGQKYFYKIRAGNVTGESNFSSEISAIPVQTAKIPNPPLNVIASAGDKSTIITFDSSQKAITYTLYWDTKTPISKNSKKISNIISPFIHKNLTNGTTYYYAITASNVVGESQLSGETSAMPREATTRPQPPKSVSVAGGDKHTIITFNNSQWATSYTLYWDTIGPVSKSSNGVENISSPHTHNNLTNGITYYYAVSASNAIGESDLSDEVNAIPSPPPPLPPQNVTAIAGNQETTISFDQSLGATSYTIYWDTITPITKNSNKFTVISSPYTHTGLTNGVTVYYAMTASNLLSESDLSNETFATPHEVLLPPQPPQSISAIGGDKQATITFDSSLGATFYNLYWDTLSPITKNSNKNDTIFSPYVHTALLNGETYYYAVTAQNDVGESDLSDEVRVMCNITVTDIDGNVYHTVVIGNQIWTVENLRTTRYNDGTEIPHITSTADWDNLSADGYCFYGNTTDTTQQRKDGAFYTWHTVNTGKLAPQGWRVPNDNAWQQLINYLTNNGFGHGGSGDDIAKSLAAKSSWKSHNSPGRVGNDQQSNNSTGFSGLSTGYRLHTGSFRNRTEMCYWWSTKGETTSAHAFRMSHEDSKLFRNDYGGKTNGFNVRLVKDIVSEE